MKSKTRWFLILIASFVADIVIRFSSNFDFGKIMVGEAILFSLIAIFFALLIRFDHNTTAWPRWIRITLAWFYGLGGIRCILWVSGVPLLVANVVTGVTFVFVALYYFLMRRRTAQ